MRIYLSFFWRRISACNFFLSSWIFPKQRFSPSQPPSPPLHFPKEMWYQRRKGQKNIPRKKSLGKDEADRRHDPMCVLITLLFLEKIIFCAFAIAMQRLIFQVFPMLYAVLTHNYITTILQKQTFHFCRQVAPGSAENAVPSPRIFDSVSTQLWRQKRELEK